MKLKRLTLLAKIDERLARDKKDFDLKSQTDQAEYDRRAEDWHVLYADAWDQFLKAALRRRKEGVTISYEMMPKERYKESGGYREQRIATIPDYGIPIYEPNTLLMLLRDILMSSDDDLVETKELGFKNLLGDLGIR